MTTQGEIEEQPRGSESSTATDHQTGIAPASFSLQMRTKNKARRAATAPANIRDASVIVTTPEHTASYLVVQAPSPPPSSPPPKFIIPIPIRQSPVSVEDEAPSISDLTGPQTTRQERTTKSKARERPVVQPQEVAVSNATQTHTMSLFTYSCVLQDQIQSNNQPEVQSHGGPRARAKASRAKGSRTSPSPRKVKTQQSENLVKILTRNKSLVYTCLIEDRDDSETCEKCEYYWSMCVMPWAFRGTPYL